MKELITGIEINAGPDVVWNILTDFDAYPGWNPFILSFGKKPVPGKRFSVTIQQPGSKPMTFRPVCLKMERNRTFRWLGHLFFKGLFDGEHSFELIPLGDGRTKLVHQERFSGILVPLLWKQLDTKTRLGFNQMNQKLKERAEGVEEG
jgi:hypothetical protein